MRKLYFQVPAFLLMVVVLFAGCTKEKCKRTVTSKIYTPVTVTDEAYKASVKAGPAQEIKQAGKIYVYKNYLFVNELNKGIHIIDNSNPKAPKFVSFLNIPGNVDMAVKGNSLYVDAYADLLVMDISNPVEAKVTKWMNGVLNYRVGPQGVVVGYMSSPSERVIGFDTRDTTYECDCTIPGSEVLYSDAASLNAYNSASSGSTGKGGSMARFTLAKNFLYTVNHYMLKAFDVTDASNPVHKSEQNIGGGIETIFPYGEYLFIGSRNAMYIYDIYSPAQPSKRSMVTHFQACDPVVVEGTTAYVTLRSGNMCGANRSELQVFDVANVDQPKLLNTYPMTGPYGLGIDNGKLFVCEGPYGLRFMDAPSPDKIKTAKLLEGIDTYDVIPFSNKLLVSARDGIYQFEYSDISNPQLLSKISKK